MKDILVIYHNSRKNHPCVDGIASASIADQIFFKSETDYLGLTYGEPMPNLNQYKEIYLLDFTVPATVIKGWGSQGKEVTIIDHHKNMMESLLTENFTNRVLLNYDQNESGATLTWKTLFPKDPIPPIYQYVRDRDIWKHELPATALINEGLYYLIKKVKEGYPRGFWDERLTYSCFDVFDTLIDMTQEQLEEYLVPLGKEQLSIKTEIIKEIVDDNAEVVELFGEKIVVCDYSPEHVDLRSDICAALYKKFPQYAYTIGFCQGDEADKDDKNFYLAFRSDSKGSNFDVSAIARLFGGNGHPNAAGAAVKKLPWINI